MSLTQLQYERMKKWAMGYFEAGETSEKKETSEKNEHSKTLGLLTEAALEMATGSPFSPGIEISHNAQDPDTYQDPKIPENAFRFSTKFEPGDITRSLSLPWHSDFYECNEHWWPATRPDDVVPEEKYKDTKLGDLQREKWHRGLRSTDNTDLDAGNYDGNTDMVKFWDQLGFIVEVENKDENDKSRVFLERWRTFNLSASSATENSKKIERRLFEVIKKALSNLLEDIKAIKIGVSLDNRETVEHPLWQDAEKELSELLSELPNPYVLSGDTENDLSNLLEAIKKVDIRGLLETNKDSEVLRNSVETNKASEVVSNSVENITRILNDPHYDSPEFQRQIEAILRILSHVLKTIMTYARKLFYRIVVVLIYLVRAIMVDRNQVAEIVRKIVSELNSPPSHSTSTRCTINPECEEAEKKAREAEKKAQEAENAMEAGDITDEAKKNAEKARKNADDARKNADDAKKNTKLAKQVFRSVVSQEMLHLSLAGNVLLAIGGQPKLYDRDSIPRFPELLLYRESPEESPLALNLRPATKNHIRNTFMKIEKSEFKESEFQTKRAPPPVIPYKTIGLFYEYIKVGLYILYMTQFPEDTRFGCRFAPDQSEYAPKNTGFCCQSTSHAACPKDGLVVVTDYETALKAIEIIVTQGEGNLGQGHGDQCKCSHYDMFKKLADLPGPDLETFSIQDSPRTRDYGDEKIKTTIEHFWTVSDPKERQNMVFGAMYPSMLSVMAPLAEFLVRQPMKNGKHAAPCFEYYQFTGNPKVEISGLVQKAIGFYERQGDNGAIDKLKPILNVVSNLYPIH
ncbi:ferritin-like-domain-containing protein [Jimgerdemannia flammicorona]|uniref:Ferritin-like-domain-containing protein n=1 Tax=Jimgerdemannia flammicorona TaxID=994334 RepID=A0A433QES7_9FUNG|nr:ferritin-like-domain-containing protein [Jimgerdemannia flammicorona]